MATSAGRDLDDRRRCGREFCTWKWTDHFACNVRGPCNASQFVLSFSPILNLQQTITSQSEMHGVMGGIRAFLVCMCVYCLAEFVIVVAGCGRPGKKLSFDACVAAHPPPNGSQQREGWPARAEGSDCHWLLRKWWDGQPEPTRALPKHLLRKRGDGQPEEKHVAHVFQLLRKRGRGGNSQPELKRVIWHTCFSLAGHSEMISAIFKTVWSKNDTQNEMPATISFAVI